jgi:hypothetical protein
MFTIKNGSDKVTEEDGTTIMHHAIALDDSDHA